MCNVFYICHFDLKFQSEYVYIFKRFQTLATTLCCKAAFLFRGTLLYMEEKTIKAK